MNDVLGLRRVAFAIVCAACSAASAEPVEVPPPRPLHVKSAASAHTDVTAPEPEPEQAECNDNDLEPIVACDAPTTWVPGATTIATTFADEKLCTAFHGPRCITDACMTMIWTCTSDSQATVAIYGRASSETIRPCEDDWEARFPDEATTSGHVSGHLERLTVDLLFRWIAAHFHKLGAGLHYDRGHKICSKYDGCCGVTRIPLSDSGGWWAKD
jgi:hypothetical protein